MRIFGAGGFSDYPSGNRVGARKQNIKLFHGHSPFLKNSTIILSQNSLIVNKFKVIDMRIKILTPSPKSDIIRKIKPYKRR